MVHHVSKGACLDIEHPLAGLVRWYTTGSLSQFTTTILHATKKTLERFDWQLTHAMATNIPNIKLLSADILPMKTFDKNVFQI